MLFMPSQCIDMFWTYLKYLHQWILFICHLRLHSLSIRSRHLYRYCCFDLPQWLLSSICHQYHLYRLPDWCCLLYFCSSFDL